MFLWRFLLYKTAETSARQLQINRWTDIEKLKLHCSEAIRKWWKQLRSIVNFQKRGGSLISELLLLVSVSCCPKCSNIFCLDRHEPEISAALVLPVAVWPSSLSLCAVADSNTFTENKPISRLTSVCPDLESCASVVSLSDVRFLWCSFSRCFSGLI